MKTHTWMLIGALLAVPALGFADEPAKPVAASKMFKPALNLQTAEVQKIIRESAKEQIENAAPASAAASPDPPPVTLGQQVTIPFRAPRRLHHTQCDSFNCVAYTADGDALFSIPRDQYYGQHGGDSAAKWLSCQSHNDLLTVFERYDKCRGISVGLPPVSLGNVLLDLPGLSL